MSDSAPVPIGQIRSGVPGLDAVLGGGIPEYSLNLIAGEPGTGKTTLAQQIMFANATPERPAIHFTVLGEPPIKMLRYQQQFDFFDVGRIGTDVRLVNLSDEVLQRDLDAVLERITREIQEANPSIVVVDSFRTVLRTHDGPAAAEMELQHFVQRLALRLTSWEVTSFLVGEYSEMEARNPVFTVADGLIWMSNEVERNATVRKLRSTKMRGQASLPGLHTFRISKRGVEVYPRHQPAHAFDGAGPRGTRERVSTGVPALDTMMGGGIPGGDSVLVSGPSGAGKTILATHFVTAGADAREKALVVVFEEHPEHYLARTRALGFDLERMRRAGLLDIFFLRPLDLSVDETFQEIRERVERLGATRVVIDSLSGFEVALSPVFRQDFRESLYRLVGALTALDITVLSTIEMADTRNSLHVTPYSVSFLTDDVITLRYVELDGRIQRVLSIVKMRGSRHSTDLRAYRIGSRGIELGETLSRYRGIITGVPVPSTDAPQSLFDDLPADESD